MNDEERSQLRSLAALLTSLGSRVVWDGHDRVRSIAMFGDDVQDRHLSDLRGLTGLTELNLTRSNITDAGMFYVGKLVGLESLLLGGTVISDEGAEQLDRLSNLASLNLIGTGVTDSGLRHFRTATNMQALWLERTDITDQGLSVLTSFPSLALLDIGNTFVSDAGLARVGQLAGLEELSVSSCEDVNGAGFRHLSSLTRLNRLCADNCSLSDDVLQHIVDLPLQVLSLNWTEITDTGLKTIARISTLQELHLIGACVSEEAAAEFRAAHPDCEVLHSTFRAS